MSQEPQSETPRVDSKVYRWIGQDDICPEEVSGLLDLARTLERELGEVKRDADNCRQIIDTYSRQGDDLQKLQQELSQVRGELEKYTLPSNNPLIDIPLNRQIQILNKQLVDSEQQCDLLAKWRAAIDAAMKEKHS